MTHSFIKGKFVGTAPWESDHVRREYVRFSVSWHMHPSSVRYVFQVAIEHHRRWKKISALLLQECNFKLTPRQIRYMVRRLDLVKKLGGKHPANYSDMLRRGA